MIPRRKSEAFGALVRALPLMAVAAGLFSMLFVLGCSGAQQFKTELFQQSEREGFGPNGMTWNGKDLVIAESNMVVSIYDIETGVFVSKDSPYTSVGSFKFSRDPETMSKEMNICGLAWTGDCCGRGVMWVADALNGEIVKVDPKRDIVMRLGSPGDDPSGLAFDGKNLWVADASDSKIYVMDPETGIVVKEFNSPVKVPTGLTYDNKDIWVLGITACENPKLGCSGAELLKLDVESGMVVREVKLPKGMLKPSSVTWVDKKLWVGDYDLNRVFKFSDKGTEVKDDTVYATDVSVTERKLVVQRMPVKDELGLIRDQAEYAADKAEAAADRSAASADEAKGAARDAKASADDASASAASAKDSADKSEAAARMAEKSFELQLKK